MFEQFTKSARTVVRHAVGEARADHRPVGTEHLLLGLLADGDGLAVRLLAAEGVRAEELRGAVAQAGYQPAGQPRFARFDPPWTPWFLRRNEVVLPLVDSFTRDRLPGARGVEEWHDERSVTGLDPQRTEV